MQHFQRNKDEGKCEVYMNQLGLAFYMLSSQKFVYMSHSAAQ
jgi:hypothetical protein